MVHQPAIDSQNKVLTLNQKQNVFQQIRAAYVALEHIFIIFCVCEDEEKHSGSFWYMQTYKLRNALL